MYKISYQKKALLLGTALIILAIGCFLWILFPTGNTPEIIIADIYQNGTLLESIPLSSVAEGYTLTVTGENGAVNEIEIRPGSIGITSASCPDRLCVHQGFISNSLLPITCLPNRLVIQIRQENMVPADTDDNITPDIITY